MNKSQFIQNKDVINFVTWMENILAELVQEVLSFENELSKKLQLNQAK